MLDRLSRNSRHILSPVIALALNEDGAILPVVVRWLAMDHIDNGDANAFGGRIAIGAEDASLYLPPTPRDRQG
jgi:hypothetical protein